VFLPVRSAATRAQGEVAAALAHDTKAVAHLVAAQKALRARVVADGAVLTRLRQNRARWMATGAQSATAARKKLADAKVCLRFV
jgi:hypothetical protein